MSFSGLFRGLVGTMALSRLGLAALSALTALTVGTAPAKAAVTEPNGLAVPQPVTDAELNIARSRGFADASLTLRGLFDCFGDTMLDPVADADTNPAAFSPLCGFTGTLALRGGGCRLDFGWYNANQSGQRPTEEEIFNLVPAAGSVPAGAPVQDFCPLAADHVGTDPNRADTLQIQAACNSCPDARAPGVMTFSADMIRSDPRYLAPPMGTGLIGFAIRQPAGMGTQCPETHFSENDLNTCTGTGCSAPGPWVMALVYTSKAVPDAFYVAFEDLPTSAWNPSASAKNDGDFNDFVYFITGLTCEGGGQPCTVPNVVGACAAGVTACGPGGTIVCSPRVMPTPEICDNIDNDCNGMVDDDPNLCVADNKVCYQGKCVPHCGTGEFQCGVGETCVDGLCVDIPCQGVTCGENQVCRGGQCSGGCDGVVCPLTTNGRQECQLGRCVDLCAAATCPADTVCEKGSCVRKCSCRECPDGTTCHPDDGSPLANQCEDMRCMGVQCPAGQICLEGACANPCDGVTCPGGATCENGVCGPPGTGGNGGTAGASSGTAGIVIAGTGNNGATTGNGGGSSASGGAAGNGDELHGTPPAGDPGCACRTASSNNASRLGLVVALGALGAFFGRRRQRAA